MTILIEELAYQLSGKLLLRKELPLDETEIIELLKSGLIQTTPSIVKKGFFYECQRCGNRKKSLLAKIPCMTCGTLHMYCRKCIQMGRVMECEPLYEWTGPSPVWHSLESPLTWSGELTTAQQYAAQEMVKTLKKKDSELLVWAVCGSGKTEMLFPAIEKSLQQGKRICIATPRADVVRELLPRLQQAFQNANIQGLYGGSNKHQTSSQLVIATTHQLLRYKRAFDVMIIDEMDAFPYHADPSLPFATERAQKVGASTIYLTATPRKSHINRMARKQLPHVFVPIRFHGHPSPVPRLKMCMDLRKQLTNYKPPKAFKTWLYQRKQPKRQLLIFLPTIELVEHMLKHIKAFVGDSSLSYPLHIVQAVHAEDPQREEKIQSFRERQIDVLLTTTILERGVTFPSVDVAVINAGHEVFDEAALVQIAGRAGRSASDPTGEVVFFHEGRTHAMMKAVHAIKKMNKRAGF